MDIAARAPEVTVPERWCENEAWLCGFRLYRAGFFWETHEVWEPVWAGTLPNSSERQMVQGLIQLANGCLKLLMERPKAAARLVQEAGIRLAEAGSGGERHLMGLDVGAAANGVSRFMASASSWHEREAADALRDKPVLKLSNGAL